MPPCSHHMVRCGFGSRVRRTRIVSRLFGETSNLPEGAIHFVRGNMKEPKVICTPAEFTPMLQCHVEKDVGADDIGVDEFSGTVDRSIDMTFGGQMHYGIGVECGKSATAD